MVTTKYIKSFLPRVNTKKAVGIDSILPKIVKLAADSLSELLAQATNMFIKQNDLPNNAKATSVVPLDKGKSNKHDMLYFRPASILNTFSKIYGQVIKKQIVLGIDKFLSPKISAYKLSYSTQHVITSFIEDWEEKLDQKFLVGAVLTDLSKAFDCIPHDVLIAKLPSIWI